MELSEVLEKAGLNDKQASVYLALLELGTASVQNIALKAGLKRPTTYLILDDLKLKSLVSVVPQAGKALFKAESPEFLLTGLAKKTEVLKRFLPELLAVHNLKTAKPKVLLHQGIEGFRAVYDSILNKSEVRLFGTVSGLNRLYPEWIPQFFKLVKDKELTVFDLITNDNQNASYIKQAKTIPGYHIKTLPKDLAFKNDTVIIENRVIFFSFTSNIFCVEIESPDIAKSMRVLFELGWQSTIKPN